MKNFLTIVLVQLLTLSAAAHERLEYSVQQIDSVMPRKKQKAPLVKASTDSVKVKSVKSDPGNDYGWSRRVAFMVGLGASMVATKLYTDPAIRKDNNNVVIDEASRLKPNVSLGIVWTPWLAENLRTVKILDNKKHIKYTQVIDYYPKGFTVAVFVNPISLSKINENSFTSTIDLGLGLGLRSDSFAVLGVIEVFGIRQPRQGFIDDYMGKNLPYKVGGAVQTSIDAGDTGVFAPKTGIAFGIKVAYTFDVIKRFISTDTFVADKPAVDAK